MSDFPGSTLPTPQTVTTYSLTSAAGQLHTTAGGITVTAFTWVANLAVYVPVLIPWPYTVRRVFWINGSTITSSNADFGIYTAEGTKIYSTGSTAMSGASAPQFVTPTEFTLSPGAYYFAWACNNTTSRAYGSTTAANTLRMAGVLQQASAFALPATMTGASVSNAVYPLCGITRTTSGF